MDKTPSGLPPADDPDNTESIHVEQAGNSRDMSPGQISKWKLVDSWTFSGNVTEVDFDDLGGYNELLIVARAITKGTTGTLNLRVSSDNGSSFYSASGDYVSVTTAGVEANLTSIPLHATNATAARTMVARLHNFNAAVVKAVEALTHSTLNNLITQAVALNAIRFFLSGGGNITGGSIAIYGR